MVGVGAVVWDGERVLLERRGHPPGRHLVAARRTGRGWRDRRGCLRREVREECGIEVTVGPMLGVFEPIQRDHDGRVRYHYVVMDFLALSRRRRSASRRRRRQARMGRRRADLDAYALLPATRT